MAACTQAAPSSTDDSADMVVLYGDKRFFDHTRCNAEHVVTNACTTLLADYRAASTPAESAARCACIAARRLCGSCGCNWDRAGHCRRSWPQCHHVTHHNIELESDHARSPKTIEFSSNVQRCLRGKYGAACACARCACGGDDASSLDAMGLCSLRDPRG